jgi:hypothetical protein
MTDQNSNEDLPDELEITLRKPVEFGGVRFEKIIIREPTAGQMLEWDKLSGREADVKAVCVVSGIPEPAVRMMLIRDFNEAAEHIGRFLK